MDLTKLRQKNAQDEQEIRALRKERAALREACRKATTGALKLPLLTKLLRLEGSIRWKGQQTRFYHLLSGMLRGRTYRQMEPKTRERWSFYRLPTEVYQYLPFTVEEVPYKNLCCALFAWRDGETIDIGDKFVTGAKRRVLIADIKSLEELEKTITRTLSEVEKQLQCTRFALTKARTALCTLRAKEEGE